MNTEYHLGAWLLQPFRQDRALRFSFLLLLVIAFGLRLFLVLHTAPYNSSDARDYQAFAESLMQGRGYMQVYDGETDCYQGMTFYAYRMPGYSMILAAVYSVFGYAPQAAMMVNVVADLTTLFCVAVLGWHIFGRTASILAQAVWAMHPFHATDLITESISIATFVVLATLLAHGGPLRTRREALLYGLISVAGIFIRPINVVSYLMLGVRMLAARVPFRRIVTLGLIAGLPTAFALGLWTTRNYRILGYPVLLTSQGGRVNAKDYGISFERVTFAEREKGNHNEAAISKVLKGRVAERIKSDPSLVTKIYWQRFKQLLTLNPLKDYRALHFNVLYDKPYTPDMPGWVRPLMHKLYNLYYPVYYGAALLPLLCWRSFRKWLVIALPVICYLVFHAAVTKGNVRYAASIFPHLTLMASASVAAALSMISGLVRRRAS